jgi:hypothetical protein
MAAWKVPQLFSENVILNAGCDSRFRLGVAPNPGQILRRGQDVWITVNTEQTKPSVLSSSLIQVCNKHSPEWCTSSATIHFHRQVSVIMLSLLLRRKAMGGRGVEEKNYYVSQ